MVSGAAGDQVTAYAVSDGAGGVLTAWRDFRTNGNNPDVYAARITMEGDRPWALNGSPVAVASIDESIRQTISDGAGGLIICWESGSNLLVQRLGPGGVALWSLPVVAGTAYSGLCLGWEERNCSAIMIGDGAHGAILVWRTNSLRLRAQRVDATGALAWTPDGVALSSSPSQQSQPHAVSDGAGGIIVAWDNPQGGNGDIFIQRMDAAGAALWGAAGIAMTSTPYFEHSPKVCEDGSGGAVLSWSDQGSASFAQRVDAGGNKLWAPAGVQIGGYAYRTMIPDGSGGAIITLVPAVVTPFFYVQRVAADGTTPWGSPREACHNAGGGVYGPDQCSDGAGGTIVAWADDRTGSADVYAQRISSAGAVLWSPNGVPICNATGAQGLPAPVASPSGGAIIVYHGEKVRLGFNIYTQYVSAAGILGDVPTEAAGPERSLTLSACNPCRDGMTVSFSTPAASVATLRVLDVAGRLRTELHPAAPQGVQTLATNDWPRGVYLVVLQAGKSSRAVKTVLVR